MSNLASPPNIYIYFHISTINNWRSIVVDMFNDIIKSGLYERVKEIRCCVLGNGTTDDISFFKYPKVTIFFKSPDISLCEEPTINKIYTDAQSENFRVLYIHSKGVLHNGQNINVTDWVNFLKYFMIYKYIRCLQLLPGCDAIGVNLRNQPVLHYSGNFWWSKSSHIRKLRPISVSSGSFGRHEAEFFIGYNSTKSIFLSIWSSGINHYDTRYPPEIYTGKKIKPTLLVK